MIPGLEGRTALVAGASRGIGRAVAAMLVENGAWVAMAARGEQALARAAEEVGGLPVPADLASAAGVHSVTGYLEELLGDAPDFVVMSTGAFALAPLAETDPAAFDRMIDGNLRAPFLMVRAFLPRMLARGSGHLVGIGSVAGRVSLPGNGAYGAAKFGVRGLFGVLAEEVRGTGVRATLVEPAATDTPLWDPIDPDGRADLPSRSVMLRATDVARAVVFALSQPEGVEVSTLALRSSR